MMIDENENRLEPDEYVGGKDSSCPPDSEDDNNSVIQANEGSHSSDQPNDQDDPRFHEDHSTSSTIIQPDEAALEVAQAACTAQCCSNEKGFQPVDKPTLDMIATEKRHFQPQWYKQFPWLTIFLTYKKVFVSTAVMLPSTTCFPSVRWGKRLSLKLDFRIGRRH